MKYVRVRNSNSKGKPGNGWKYGLTLLFAALAMTSKSSTVILPVVLCLCAWWVEGRWQWRNLARLGPIVLMVVFPSALTLWTQKLGGGEDPQWVRTWPERLVTMGDEVWFYLGKLLWPYPLMVNYPRWQIDADRWFSYLPLLAVIAVIFVLWRNLKSWSRPWFFVFAYFLVALFPVLGLVDIYFQRYAFVADHFQYLAGMGPLALAGVGLAQFSDFVVLGRRWLQSSLYAGVLLILGIWSWQRAWVYQSEETLWTDTVTKNPNSWLGHYSLGFALLKKGQVDEAIARFQKALEIQPNCIEAHTEIAIALFQKGQVDEAVAQFQKVLEINPNDVETHDNLGKILVQKGQVDEAIIHFQKALKINPNNADVHIHLGDILSKRERLDEAIAQYQQALQINPNLVGVYDSLGNALIQRGQIDEAIVQFQKALKIDPKFVNAHFSLGNVLIQKRQIDEAMVQYQASLKINPNFADAHFGLGVALVYKGQMDEAIAQFQKAVEINP
ncbi:MAG TPA: tetratricopeptide repeat protein, partial [Candidatus Methylacidiphilales bacterium]|nr:tetratricopeptide repeat protein [Candidatus Methylacidiphilales bacterium]